MTEFAREVIAANIEDELKRSYLDYSMSVIVGRALPDVKDGLKPVHRRVLYAMHESSHHWNRAHVKSARVVGEVMGKYHPHGDSAIYDTLVRMAQAFSLRYPLIDGQGNFGSVDGDSPAAMRYTESRLSRIAGELLADIDMDTVDFVPNYDGKESEPAVLPSRLPNLLVNGSTGIAVGMATNIPPHNLVEVVNACVAMIDDPEIDLDGLMVHLPGPDFPTAASINGAAGIREAYATGRGKIYMRARVEIEEDKKTGKASLVIFELPYQVNKAHLLEKVAELVKEKRIEGITEIRDESDKDGMRAVIELRRGEVPEVVLNHLYQQTQLQAVFGINMVALVDGQPRQLTLHEVLEAFIRHRREVVSRRTLFALRKARDRLHILEGLAVALANIERVIALIRGSQTTEEARAKLTAEGFAPGFVGEMLTRALGVDAQRPTETGRGLIDGAYYLSDRQVQAILDMRLQRLTGLERDKIVDEYGELTVQIADLLDILGSDTRLLTEIRRELLEIRDQYGDKRRTTIMVDRLDLTSEDLIAQQDLVVTFSHQGYCKSQRVSEYRSQHRGGRGRSAARVKEEDFIERLFVANSHDTLLCFSNAGKVYWLKVYELPLAGSGSRGRPIVNLLPLGEGERISAVLPVREFDAERFVVFASRRGLVKKTALANYSRPRSAGIIALDIVDGDALVAVALTGGSDHVLLFTDDGKVLRFDERDVRPMGRDARGVRGMRLSQDQNLIGMVVGQAEGDILTVTANGYGKRTPLPDYPVRGRGGMGVISIQTSARNGPVVGAVQVVESEQVMLVTNAGTAIRTTVASISLLGRNTQGVKLMGVGEGELLAGLAVVAPEDEESDGEPIDGDVDTDIDADPMAADPGDADPADDTQPGDGSPDE
ncbi:DNA gyrase subunit A [Immundisolibacter cernigliae]|uniref:DNA gyrase subunit A n=1 Tax=Immundisolibacter cernigliae TaxID=1810504 RepID=A0A1B1YW45_9GAMM|nr:DNA gyrase subunit A [Immundisolibacter cernigliae]ANX04986.1 DNA gyrase subunit A [Immundisolibacter cernigliae]